MAFAMKRISTHVLDTSRGKPAGGVPVRLEFLDASGSWRLLQSAHTDTDGRCNQLLAGDDLPSGLYRLAFDTASYFGVLKVQSLYPVVEVTFHVREGEAQFHLPLLLSAHGYTTYRGS
jgi:5-hydroxyisourate hydrolase